MYNFITCETTEDGDITTLLFADAERHNQLCWAAIDELADALKECRLAGASVVILASGLAGHWLEHAWLEDLCAGIEGREQTGTGAGWLKALQELTHDELISIAAISGNTSGGGAELGWACDFRVAEKGVTFTQPEINMGLTTGIGGCSRLLRLAGVTAATEMVLSGRPLSAQRLGELGALNDVVDPGTSLARAMAIARELAGKPLMARCGLKRILRRAEELPLKESLIFEQETFQEIAMSKEAVRRMKSVQADYDRGQK